jgi:outer membrane protein
MNIHPFFPALLLLASAATALAGPGSVSSFREITMGECVEEALRSNIGVAVSRSVREEVWLGISREEAVFLPRLIGDVSIGRAIGPTGSSIAGTFTIDQRIWRFDAEVTELLRSGTTLSLTFENQMLEAGSALALFNPEYRTGLTLSARHPLLKHSGKEVTEAPLRIARAEAEAGTGDWLAKVMDTVASARTSFLLFHAASREVEVRKTAAPSDRLYAEAAVAARKEEFLRAEASARNAEDDLKIVLGLRADQEWDERLVPVAPRDVPFPPDADDTFEEALHRRPEVSAVAARTRQAEVQESIARNGTLPDLSLTASGGLSGYAGTPVANPLFPDGGGGTDLEGGYGESLGNLVSGDYYNWFVGLSTEIPWKFQRERADLARARRALEQQRLREEELRARIRTEVRKAHRDLTSALARVDAAAASVAAARGKLQAEERKLALGSSTTTQVLEVQQDYAQALLAESRARTDAHVSQTRLWRAVGTILDKEGISVR